MMYKQNKNINSDFFKTIKRKQVINSGTEKYNS